MEIEKLLAELMDKKEDLEDIKAILKHYKIDSPRLKELKEAQKQLKAQIDEEKARIEEEYNIDEDYSDSKVREAELKLDIKEKRNNLKKKMGRINTSEEISQYEYNIKGEQIKMQVERLCKVYLNGKEEK